MFHLTHEAISALVPSDPADTLSETLELCALSRVLFMFRGENEAVIDLITSDTLSGALSFLLFLSCVKSSIVHVS